MRRFLAACAVVAAATGASAQEPTAAQSLAAVDAAEYIRGLIQNDRYDPRDRERALNGAAEASDSHWRSSIFDGRRTRATRSTGFRLPDLPPADAD